jgi:hypothetical protein
MYKHTLLLVTKNFLRKPPHFNVALIGKSVSTYVVGLGTSSEVRVITQSPLIAISPTHSTFYNLCY